MGNCKSATIIDGKLCTCHRVIVIISDNRCTCKRFVRISDCLVSEREGGRRERERERERGREERGGREQREWEGDRETMKSKSYTG